MYCRAIRLWCREFGLALTRNLRRRQGQLGDDWKLDEIFKPGRAQRRYLWKEVGRDGDLLSILFPDTSLSFSPLPEHQHSAPSAADTAGMNPTWLKCGFTITVCRACNHRICPPVQVLFESPPPVAANSAALALAGSRLHAPGAPARSSHLPEG